MKDNKQTTDESQSRPESYLKLYASKLHLWSADLYDKLLHDLQSVKSTAVEAIYKQPFSGDKRMYELKKQMRMPFHFMPSCSRFKAVISPYDWVFALLGIAIRANRSEIEIRNWRNGKANKFIFYMFRLLGRKRDTGDAEEYWRIAWHLMKSHAYQSCAFDHVCHNWHREMSIREVNRIMNQVKELVATRATAIQFKRVYIPKGTDKWRPLGVPSKAWRVYLHMLNNLVVWFRTGREYNQHAYFPDRGVHTAWEEIFKRIDEANIYEFDLEEFFPSVNLDYNYETLIRIYGMPEKQAAMFRELNRSIVQLPKDPKEDKLQESDREVAFQADGHSLNPNAPWTSVPPEFFGVYWNYGLSLGPSPLANLGRVSAKFAGYSSKVKGVPQGAATSCGLSTINLEGLWRHWKDRLVMYADDGLVFPESSVTEPRVWDIRAGVKVSPSKSKWVKRDGIWLTPLKFLGILYVPEGMNPDGSLNPGRPASIQAKTRSGATLEFGTRHQLLAHLLTQRDLLYDRLDPEGSLLIESSGSHLNTLGTYLRGKTVGGWVMEELKRFYSLKHPQSLLFKGRWSGNFLARLYADSWSSQEPQNSDLTSSKGSWIRKVWPKYSYRRTRDMAVPLLESQLTTLVRERKRVERALHGSHPGSIIFHSAGQKRRLERSIERLTSKIVNLDQAISHFTQGGLDKSTVPISKVEPQSTDYRPPGWVKAKLQKKHASPEWQEMLRKKQESLERAEAADFTHVNQIRGWYRLLGEALQINVYNASTFACDSLLTEFPFEEKPLIRYYYKDHPEKNKSKTQEKSWEEQIPVMRAKLWTKMKKEFKLTFGLKPQIQSRSYSTSRPVATFQWTPKVLEWRPKIERLFLFILRPLGLVLSFLITICIYLKWLFSIPINLPAMPVPEVLWDDKEREIWLHQSPLLTRAMLAVHYLLVVPFLQLLRELGYIVASLSILAIGLYHFDPSEWYCPSHCIRPYVHTECVGSVPPVSASTDWATLALVAVSMGLVMLLWLAWNDLHLQEQLYREMLGRSESVVNSLIESRDKLAQALQASADTITELRAHHDSALSKVRELGESLQAKESDLEEATNLLNSSAEAMSAMRQRYNLLESLLAKANHRIEGLSSYSELDYPSEALSRSLPETTGSLLCPLEDNYALAESALSRFLMFYQSSGHGSDISGGNFWRPHWDYIASICHQIEGLEADSLTTVPSYIGS